MKQMNHYLIATTMAAALVFTASPARAEHEKEFHRASQARASELIGKEVRNTTDESLGKIDELIVNVNSGSVPYAIIAHGGALGVGRTKTAVPMSALECSADGKYLTLATTKEDLKSASKMAPATWALASDAEWVKSVDGFYGTPGKFARDRMDRDREDRLYVRDPKQKGAEALMRPADALLCEKVCDAIDNVQVNVNEGTVTLRGTVESEQAKRNLETKARSIPGVQRVENNLRVR